MADIDLPTRIIRALGIFVALLAGGLGLSAGNAFATGETVTPCERTAKRMQRACRLDVQEEFSVNIANCLNISDPAERQACRDEANEVRAEEPEACADQRDARMELCELLGEVRYDPDPLLDPLNTFINPNRVPHVWPANPLLSLEKGLVSVLRSGEEGEELVVILNTDETREILGVECRIVAEFAVEEVLEEDERDGYEYEYVPKELTFDYYAQTMEGAIIYCGENTVEFEDGYPTSTDGTFIAGVDFAKSGVLLRSNPQVGDADRQEFALDEAEDWVQYEDLYATPSDDQGGENQAFPCRGNCVQTTDGTPLEPEAIELKYYRPGTGFVLALPFEDDEWNGEREERVCDGRSLRILNRPKCGIEDPEELFETLCSVAGEYFCDD
jgi:hypothetical protein